MDDLDPTELDSLEDLAACLQRVHLRADRPAYRELEKRSNHAKGLLPGTRLERTRLGRTTLTDVLRARKFPGKAFMLTFIDACGIDLETDRRWEHAWDRLAERYLVQGASAEAEQLRQQLAAALAAQAEADQARQRAENATQQEREKARSEIERLQVELMTRIAELEQARTEAAQALEAVRAQAHESSLDPVLGALSYEVIEMLRWFGRGHSFGDIGARFACDERIVARQLVGLDEAFVRTRQLHIIQRSRGKGYQLTRVGQVFIDLLEPITDATRGAVEAAASSIQEQAVRVAVPVPRRAGAASATVDSVVRAAEVGVYSPESGSEVTVRRWLKKQGDHVDIDERLVEVSTKNTLAFGDYTEMVSSPASGTLRLMTTLEDETVTAGGLLAIIEPDQAS